jgi:hypothetical protein
VNLSIATSPLSYYLTETPDKNARHFHRQSILYSIAEKVSWVAAAAITAAVIITSITNPVVSGTISLTMIGLSFSIIFLAWGAMICRNYSKEAAEQAKTEEQVEQTLKDVKNWDDQKVEEFLYVRDKKISLNSLKPLVARIVHLEESAKKIRDVSLKALKKNFSIETDETKRQRNYISRMVHSWNLETKAYPKLFQAALLYLLPLDQTAKSTEKIGYFSVKSHAERLSDLVHNNDERYFNFYNREDSITCLEMEKISSKELAQKLSINALNESSSSSNS